MPETNDTPPSYSSLANLLSQAPYSNKREAAVKARNEEEEVRKTGGQIVTQYIDLDGKKAKKTMRHEPIYHEGKIVLGSDGEPVDDGSIYYGPDNKPLVSYKHPDGRIIAMPYDPSMVHLADSDPPTWDLTR